MKRNRKPKLRLRDLVSIVSRYSRNEGELALVVADLINRGRVRLLGNYQHARVVVR